jgi:hypothetical protein
MKNRFKYNEKEFSTFPESIRKYGWVVYENAVDNDFLDMINADLVVGYDVRRAIQEKNNISANMQGTLHHLLERDNFSIPFLQKMYCHDEIMQFLEGNYILNGINAVIPKQMGLRISFQVRTNRLCGLMKTFFSTLLIGLLHPKAA